MRILEIVGGNRLSGRIKLQGAKNSILPILSASLLIKGRSIIHNCPDITDVDAATKILVMLGCTVLRDGNTLIIDSYGATNHSVGKELMREMRSSVLFLGAIISRMGKTVLSSPGGCELGPRPIDLHIDALKKLGAVIKEEDSLLYCDATNGLTGTEINLKFASVGATENIIITACLAKGRTIIRNAATEPEISDLADFLNKAGAKIKGAGNSTVIIDGVTQLKDTEHTVIPDRIVAATYMSCCAITDGDVLIEDCRADHMVEVIRFFEKIGCYIKFENKNLHIKSNGNLLCTGEIITGVYPAFPTDAGPIAVPLFCKLKGKSSIKETIFENRFRYIDELNKFGLGIKKENNTAYVENINEFSPADVHCTDLRGGAALLIAALAARGTSTIGDIHHIERGYEKISQNLSLIGANIRESEDG